MRNPTQAEIARSAGVSKATVDRVLNDRPGVQDHTRAHVLRVVAAMKGNMPVAVDALRIDIVLPPDENVWIGELAAFLQEQAASRPEVRLKVHSESLSAGAIAARLRSLAGRTDAVGLVALDTPETRDAVRRLTMQGTPVITIASPLGPCGQSSYVGIDNRAAGRLAGDLIGRFVQGKEIKVALVPGVSAYRGHEEREAGFRDVVAERFPDMTIVRVPEVRDSPLRSAAIFGETLQAHPDLAAVYCIGGGISGVVKALGDRAQDMVVIAHELTEETRPLMIDGSLDAVIDQNGAAEAREVIDRLIAAHSKPFASPGKLVRIQTFFRESIPSDS